MVLAPARCSAVHCSSAALAALRWKMWRAEASECRLDLTLFCKALMICAWAMHCYDSGIGKDKFTSQVMLNEGEQRVIPVPT